MTKKFAFKDPLSLKFHDQTDITTYKQLKVDLKVCLNLGQQIWVSKNSFLIQAVIQSERMDSFPNPDKLNDKLIGYEFFPKTPFKFKETQKKDL